MAQPSVAREPSMEEILASIRRIIESNEPGPAGAFSGQLPPVYDDEDDAAGEAAFVTEPVSPPARVPPAANQAYGARPAQDFPQDYSSASERPMPEQLEISAEKTMSLADVAARVRAAADRNAAMGPQAFAAQAQRGATEPAPAAPAASSSSVVPAERPAPQRPTDVRPLMAATAAAAGEQPVPFAAEDRAAAAAIENAPFAESPFDQLALRGAIETPLVKEHFEIGVNQPAVEMPKFEPVEQETESALSLNLISAAAGAQIARSFSELAEIFDGVERRSIEDLAAEMLRPMLQDWLEDNLPTLVERLVREEIERVARGSRR
ncbi:DUF2497 domain-containing protein [Agrobacterium sp. ICMP 6402]|uniref:cell division protein PopZ n=1 Tax=Agrobacterium sp. ICMP 6402 TaxID=2292443 RepID=UPI001297368C|nr:cell division protein PopZ [Agrobacterium sp. ICMP 6402]MQB09495.1 DUF2497 domain-containing protein [Agrobacterium sp. ICMP 6402]